MMRSWNKAKPQLLYVLYDNLRSCGLSTLSTPTWFSWIQLTCRESTDHQHNICASQCIPSMMNIQGEAGLDYFECASTPFKLCRQHSPKMEQHTHNHRPMKATGLALLAMPPSHHPCIKPAAHVSVAQPCRTNSAQLQGSCQNPHHGIHHDPKPASRAYSLAQGGQVNTYTHFNIPTL